MQKKYRIGLIIIIVLIILVLALGISRHFFQKNVSISKNTTKVISNIDKYNYTLDDRDSDYMKEIYNELKDILESDEIDYEKYATCLAKLFVIDFYTLNNKINKYDVGSLEYILSDKKEMFKTKAMDTIYRDIIDNTYKDRLQELPLITNVEIINITKDVITLNEKETECYKLTMEYTYQKDLGYDTKGTIYLVKNQNKLEVAIYNPEINEINN